MRVLYVFLSHHFDDRQLVGLVSRLLESIYIKPIIGRPLGGGELTPEIKKRIEESDGCIALMTRDEPLPSGKWTTRNWIRDEINHARVKEIRSIALVEEGVLVDGAYADRETITFNREDPLEMLLSLLETLKEWRDDIGLIRKARVSPNGLGAQFLRDPALKFHYRCVSPIDGKKGPWREATPLQEQGGTSVYLDGIGHEGDQIEVEVLKSDSKLYSRLTTQSMYIALEDLP